MDSLVSRLEQIALTGNDLCDMVRKLGNHGVRVHHYDDLGSLSADELFGDSNSVLLLLELKASKIGHWVLLVKNDDVYFYDPYGFSVQEIMKLTGEKNYIHKLFPKLAWNHHRHQLVKDEVNTCGRHCVSRALFHFLSNDEYHERVITPLLGNHIVPNADAYVSLMTAFLDDSDRVLFRFFT